MDADDPMRQHDKHRDPTQLTEHKISVLLVDDQAIVAEAVRRMLEAETDIVFHYCSDPTQAIDTAIRVSATIILQDLVMPEVDGLVLVRFIRAHPATRDIPLIVLSTKEEPVIKAQAFSLGANDYLVKLPDRVELIARIRYHSRAYIHLLQRNEAYNALLASQRELAEDVARAQQYVMSLLPERITDDGAVRTDWSFIPCAALGGDSFGYHWIDNEHFAFYVLDVCGHGVKSALLSVSAMNVLRSQSLPDCDFRDPASVLMKLNDAFLMEKQNDMYFTIWYGVYHKERRELRYSGGGHPPALLVPANRSTDGSECEALKSSGPMIGIVEGMSYSAEVRTLATGTAIYLYSDGAFELHKADGTMWTYNEFVECMSQTPDNGQSKIEHALAAGQSVLQGEPLLDDLSLIEFLFP